jgi:ephrin-B
LLQTRPAWSENEWTRVDRITADQGRHQSRARVAATDAFNVETRSVPVTKRGVYFALRDQGACTSILSVKVGVSSGL